MDPSDDNDLESFNIGQEINLSQEEFQNGFDFDTPEEYLLYHSRIGSSIVVEKLLLLAKSNDIKLNINCKGKQKANFGWTPLHLACYFGHYNVAKLLIEHNVKVNVTNGVGDTPLHKAAYIGRLDIVTLLLSNNADVFITNGERQTPKNVCQDEEVIQVLLAAEQSDMKKKEEKFLSASREGDVETLKNLLIDLIPVDINCKNSVGNTALHCAAYCAQKEVIVFLLQNGIDSSIKNNRGQVAANLATTLQIKQLISEVHPVNMSVNMKKLAKCLRSRFEGALIRRGKFIVRRNIWAVIERGVISFFSNRADASTGMKRRGHKYLESAIVEADSKDDTSFVVYFADNSKIFLSVPNVGQPSDCQLNRQKWINAIQDHIDHSNKFIRQGIRIDDDDDDDDDNEILSTPSIQPMISSAQAHLAILQKHIKSLMVLVKEDMHTFLSLYETSRGSCVYVQDADRAELKNFWPSFKFHLNLILESGEKTSVSLGESITLLSKQDQLRQLISQRDQERIRVLEESLRALAVEHHDFKESIISTVPYHSPPRVASYLSDTDNEEYLDAYNDEFNSDDNTESNFYSARPGLDSQSDDDTRVFSEASNVFGTPDASFSAPDHTVAQIKSRNRLPAPMISRNDIGLWSILKHCIGKELSKITMPVVFNEPLSFLQRITENVEYIQLLDKADECDDPIERIELVAAYAVSALSSNWLRMNKPFNPLLGETYELIREDMGIRMISEQVSHHPPVSAYHVESKHFELHGSCHPKLKFWGKSVEIKPEGMITLKLNKHNEVYTWKRVNCCVHNVIVGRLWFEQYGTMEIINHMNGLSVKLDFKPAGWFGKDLNRIDGYIYSKCKSEKLRFLYGKWTDYIKSASIENFENYMKDHSKEFSVPDKPSENECDLISSSKQKKVVTKLNSLTKTFLSKSNENTSQASVDINENGELPKSDSSHSLDIPNSKLLWMVKPRPENSSDYYHFTLFTISLNELKEEMRKYLPQTDSRLRPDIRLLEEGDLDGAAEEKNRLEEKQREARKIRKRKKETWQSLWFSLKVNAFTQEEDWIFNHTYWKRDYSKSNNIF